MKSSFRVPAYRPTHHGTGERKRKLILRDFMFRFVKKINDVDGDEFSNQIWCLGDALH